MLSRRIAATRVPAHAVAPHLARRPQFIQQVRTALGPALAEVEKLNDSNDPNMVPRLQALYPPWKLTAAERRLHQPPRRVPE